MNCVEMIDIDGFGNKLINDSKNLKHNLDSYLSILENVKRNSKEDNEYYKYLSTHIKILEKLVELSDETGKLLKELSSKIENYSGRSING